MATVIDDLAQVPLFSGLNKRQLRGLARGFKHREYRPGRTVVRQGHMDGVGLFIIADGTASVGVDGTEVAKLGPGDYFGELALINQQARSATVTAETPLRCLMIAFWDFRKFAKANPDVSWKLLEHLVDLLTEERNRRSRALSQTS
jgi:CRP-like cAMP-binding protein